MPGGKSLNPSFRGSSNIFYEKLDKTALCVILFKTDG